ncbi:MAG: hypothetical protein ABUL57_00805, partial [Chloroflexota bacterium]
MTSTEPGERRRLAEAPSARYAPRAPSAPAPASSSLRGPLLRAIVVAILGAAALVVVGAVLASTFGLLFVAGAMGVGIGLVLARASVAPDGSLTAVSKATVGRLAMLIALAAVVAADLATWIYAIGEGGTLGPIDYLWTTFGPFVPGVAVAA